MRGDLVGRECAAEDAEVLFLPHVAHLRRACSMQAVAVRIGIVGNCIAKSIPDKRDVRSDVAGD